MSKKSKSLKKKCFVPGGVWAKKGNKLDSDSFDEVAILEHIDTDIDATEAYLGYIKGSCTPECNVGASDLIKTHKPLGILSRIVVHGKYDPQAAWMIGGDTFVIIESEGCNVYGIQFDGCGDCIANNYYKTTLSRNGEYIGVVKDYYYDEPS
jgi:hypothetical protein